MAKINDPVDIAKLFDGDAGDEDEAATVDVPLDQYTKQLKCIARADVRMLYDKYGTMITPRDWPDELAFSIKKVTPHSSGGYVVEFHDKRAAIDTLAKLHGLYEEKKDPNPLEDKLAKVPRDDIINIRDFLNELAQVDA